MLTDPLPEWPECCWQPERVRVSGAAAAGYLARGWFGLPRPYMGDAAVSYTPAATFTPIFRWHPLAEYGLTVGAAFNLPPRIRGDVAARYTPRGRFYKKPWVNGNAQLGYVAPAGFVPGWPIVGRAQLGYASSAEMERVPRVAGLVVAGYRPAADMVGPHQWAGAAALGYTPRALMSEIPFVRGQAQLGYSAAGLVRPVWTIAGRAQLGYAPAARGGPIYRYAGRCTVAYSARSALVRRQSIAGKATMQLTPKATFTYIPAATPGASCSAAGHMVLGTTYGPFGQPPSSGNDWWTFDGVSGTTYAVTVNTGSTPFWSGTITQGSCPNPATGLGSVNATGGTTNVTASSTGPVYVKFTRTFGTGATYTIHVS